MKERNLVLEQLAAWLEKCATKGRPSRNTVAVGIVVLDHLRNKCPLEENEAFSARGELRGARSGLSNILEKYGVSGKYLKEVTTRAGHQDAQKLLKILDHGRGMAALPEKKRDRFLLAAIETLVQHAKDWLERQHLKVNCDRQLSPDAWIGNILLEAKGRSGGKVEQHLVGAKLERRHPDIEIPNNPGNAGDAQTGRAADFVVGTTAYHVTAAPGSAVLQKCKANLQAGLHPVLLVPGNQVDKARHIAEDQGIRSRTSIFAIEDFIGVNIVELSKGENRQFASELRSIIAAYNRRLEEVETDLSLKIEIE